MHLGKWQIAIPPRGSFHLTANGNRFELH